jgi:hypothetical protein
MSDRFGRLILNSLVGALLAVSLFASGADALPRPGGPAIIDAAWDGTSKLYTVFNETLDAGSINLSDFDFTDPTIVPIGGAIGGDIFELWPFASNVPDSTDSVFISWIEVLASSPDQLLSNEATPIPINKGPIIRSAVLTTNLDDDPTNDALVVTLSESASNVDSTDFAFSMALSDTALNVVGGPTVYTLTNFRFATAPDSAVQLLPYITTIAFRAGNDVENAAGDTATSRVWHRITNAEGAYILDAAYDSLSTPGLGDDTLYIVYNMPVRADTINLNDVTTIDRADFAIGGTGTLDLAGANPDLSEPVEQPWAPWIVKFTNPATGAAAGDNIGHSGTDVMQNDMWDPNTETTPHAVSLGPIILAALHKDNLTGGQDSVIVHFSQQVTGSTVQDGAFFIRGFTPNGASNWVGTGRRFARRVNDNSWSEGATIAINTGAATPIEGSASGEVATSGVFHPVRYNNPPTMSDIIQVRTDLVREFSWPNDSSIARIAWREASGTDRVKYYKLFTRIGAAVTDTFVTANWNRGIPVFNPTPNRDNPIIAYLNITPDSVVSNRDVIEDGDIIHVGIVGIDYNGNFGVINFAGTQQAIALQQTFVAGHIDDIRDWILAGDPKFGQDDNVIHVIGRWNAAGTLNDSIYADSGCVEANARVVVYGDAALTETLAVANANGGGAWGPVNMGHDNGDDDNFVWLVAYDQWGNASAPFAHLNDIFSARIGNMIDPYNPLRIYANGDSIVVKLDFSGAGDTTRVNPLALDPYLTYLNLAASRGRMWADFSKVDTYAGNDSIAFKNWLSDKIDNNANWDTSLAGGDTYQPFANQMNWPEPFIDENGNGVWDLGEEFWNIADTAYTNHGGNKLYNIGDLSLDYNDPEERLFWAVLDTIRASTSVTDESGLPKTETGFAVIKDLPVIVNLMDSHQNLSLDTMLIDLDQVAPEVCYISRVEQQDSQWDADEETNMQEPGLQIFKIGNWIDLTFETPSDSLVDYLVVQIKKNGGSWTEMALDPKGDNAGDGGFPGIDGFDDDGDGLADTADVQVKAAINTPLSDGVDNNNDGTVDNDADTLYAHYMHWDDDEDGMIDGSTISTLSLDGLGRAGTGVDYMPWLLDVANWWDTSGDTLKGLGKNPNGVYGDESVSAADSAFHWFFQNGFNINMGLVASLYGITDADTFEVRALAYDWVGQSIGPKIGYHDDSVAVGHWYLPPSATGIWYNPANRTGNFNPDNSTSEKFVLNLTAEDATIDVAAFGAYDVKPLAGIQVFDSYDSTQNVPPTPATYLIKAITNPDVAEVVFEMYDQGTSSWGLAGTDNNAPHTYLYTAPIMGNSPPDSTLDVYFRVRSKDTFGNWEILDTTLATYDLMFTVVDGVIPITNISSCEVLGGNIDTDLSNGCEVPKDSVVIFRITGSDLDDRDLTTFTDVPFVRFEYRKVTYGKAETAYGDWEIMGSVTGTISGTDTLADLYPPVAVTWNTADTLITEGDYEIRAWARDVEGNDNKLTTFIFTAKVRETGLRAYIDPPTRLDDSTFALYAKVWIHDIEVDRVDFQYWYDQDADGTPNDAGSYWVHITRDDNDDTLSADPGGDIILREGAGTLRILDSLHGAWGANLYRSFPANHKYVDYDGDGYSERDPVVVSADAVYDAGDAVAWGTPTIGDPLTSFDPIEFWVDADVSGGLTAGDWIMRQNMGGFLQNGPTDSLQLWMGNWNVAGLGSQYLVRAVATDELGNTDTTSAGSPIPYEVISLDTEAPAATIAAIALGHGGEKTVGAAALNNLIVAGDNGFIKIWAASPDTDVDYVSFEFSLNGGATWSVLDVNDDNDFFVNLDDLPGFTAGDAIVHDRYADDTTFTVTPTDVLLRNGIAPALADMLGMRIHPLITEDSPDLTDDDGDGVEGEDPFDNQDSIEPWAVYMDIDALTALGWFHTDTQVLIRARATDKTGNTDPFPHYVSITIQENVPPETDVIYAFSNGDTIDVLGPVADGDAGDQLGADDTTLDLMVTAEDTTTVDSVYVWFRLDPCYYSDPDLNIFNNPWARANVPADAVYPYEFAWDISGLTDGRYQFSIGATDEQLNQTPPHVNPYEFGRLSTEAVIDTAARPLAKAAAEEIHYTDTVLDWVTRGSELWIRAELTASPNAADAGKAAVWFWYANRVLDEVLTVQNFYPYISSAVQAGGIQGDETNYAYSVDVAIDTGAADGVCTYHTQTDFDALASPTKFDFTIVGGNKIKFGAQLASTDTAYVSYNFGPWYPIEDSPDDDVDANGFFTTAWDPTNPVPMPASPYTDAYDLIATVQYDFGGSCGTALSEGALSESKIVLLKRTEGPEVTLHGFFWPCCGATMPYNYVGNPLTRSMDDHQKSKLCGIEYDAMVLVDSVDADSVKMMFNNDGVYYPLTHYVTGDTLLLTISMNEEDFLADSLAIFSDSIENVRLLWNVGGSSKYFTMYDDGAHNDGAAGDGWWSAQVPIAVTGGTQVFLYKFDIDMSGDEKIVTWDPRNRAGAFSDTSKVTIPSDFWHTNFAGSALPNGAHTVTAYAWGNEQVGTNDESAQGPNYFIIDCVDPCVTDLYVLPSIIGTSGPCSLLTLVAVMNDCGSSITEILEDYYVSFQFATDESKTRWVELHGETVFSVEDGWVFTGAWPAIYYPGSDHIDNDNDGWTDEEDEKDYTFSLRVVAVDDTWNVTIFEQGEVRLDMNPPTIVMTSPAQGTVVAWGDTITICAKPATAADAVGLDYYEFYFAESSGVWHRIDPTPVDNSDPERVPANGMNPVCVKFATNWLSFERDQYVQFVALAVDSACNTSPYPTPIIAAVNDVTGPSACIVWFDDCETMYVSDPHLAVSGEDVTVYGKIFPNDPMEFSIVEFWAQPVGGTAVLVGVQSITMPPPAGGLIYFSWNAASFAADGETKLVDLWMLARDLDGNPDPTPLKVRVKVDRVKPTVNYTIEKFVTALWYHDDDDDPSGPKDSTLVVTPDPVTGDLTFRVRTAHSDVKSMVLQYRKAGDWYQSLGNWQNFTIGQAPAMLDFEPQHTRLVGGVTYYYWWYNIDASVVNTIALADTIYEWRVMATDYACNTNILDPNFITAAWDTDEPTCEFFGNNAIADGSIGQVAAGDDVMLRLVGVDRGENGFGTDITHAVFWYVEPWSGDTVIIGSATAVPDSIDCPCNKWTMEKVWTTPYPLCRDWTFTVGSWMYDTPGNMQTCTQTIRVEDRDAPTGTRLVDADADCIYPREITETVLNNTNVKPIRFSGTAFLTAVTAGCDSGVATVYFATVSAAGDTTYIGFADSTAAGKSGIGVQAAGGVYTAYWNSLALDVYGQPLWPDGAYKVIVWAVDLEDNREIPTRVFNFVVDNIEPIVKVTSPGSPGTVSIPVERGSQVPLTAATYSAWTGGQVTTNEDVTVYWYIRNHQDANCQDGCEECWTFMSAANGFYGVDATDANPDSTRPYSWEWATWRNVPKLEVGNEYDIIAVGEDLVCNVADICDAWAAGGGITIKVFDNTAPCATITHLYRNVCDMDAVEQPVRERVRGLASLRATILRGDSDVEGVRFEYSTNNGTTWILADQDLVFPDSTNLWAWTLGNWDSDQIAEGSILFRAVAWDDVGNTCTSSPTITLIIDRTPPVITAVAPTNNATCPFQYNPSGQHIVPLIVTSSSDQSKNPDFLYFEWKLSVESDSSDWSDIGIQEWRFDHGTGYYTGTFNVEAGGQGSHKYDFRVVASDSACNEIKTVIAREVVIDIDDPVVAMTRVEVTRADENNEETTVVFPVNNGLIIDITKGEPVKLFATVWDDERNIPAPLETGIDSVFFEVSADSNGTWYHIDLGTPDVGEGIYSASWNTTGLAPGDYYVRARAIDECKNVGLSGWIIVHVIDNVPPRAAVISWAPCVLNDINVTTRVVVYATKWCTQQVDEVMFQYRPYRAMGKDADEFAGQADADGWVTFGLQRQSVYDDSLWYAAMEIGPMTRFQIGDTLDLRAVAITLKPSQTDGRDVLYFDAHPPITTARIVAKRFGRDLEPVHPNGRPWIAINRTELLPPYTTDFLVEVEVDSMIDEDWVSIAKPWVLVNAVRKNNPGECWGYEEIVEMDPMNAGPDLDPYRWMGATANGLLDSIGCGGYVYINAAVVEDSGQAGRDVRVDVVRQTIAVHEVNSLGTRGWVSIPGDDRLSVRIPEGNGTLGAVLMTTTITPNNPQWEDQRFWLRPFGQAYKIRMIDCQGAGCRTFNDGYWAEVSIKYSEEDLWVKDYLGRDVKIDESSEILVGWWDNSYWSGYELSEVRVDTAANTVTFLVASLCDPDVYSLVGITGGYQVDMYPWCNGYTSQSPVVTATITDFLGSYYWWGTEIDEADTRIYIDNMLVASGNDYDPDRDDTWYYEGYAIGNGTFRIEHMEDAELQTVYTYRHSTLPEHRLSGGQHVFRIQYRNDDEDYWHTIEKPFMVDVVPVMAEFHGGFMGGPCVGTYNCYVGGKNQMIEVTLTDYESGVLTQESRIAAVLNIIYGSLNEFIGGRLFNGMDITFTPNESGIGFHITWSDTVIIPIQDMGLKMDVWLVDNEDDQSDIDEYMERKLIQAGTPAMLVFDPPICPYSDPSRCNNQTYYDPSDGLKVTLPLTANLKKYDGREIEVVLYSSKIEHIGMDSNLGQLFSLGGGGGDDDDEEFTKYVFGPFDCVGNVGSAYVARRFIIDASAPQIVFSSPGSGAVVTPGSEIPVVAVLVDTSGTGSGSGVNSATLCATLTGPKGQVFHFCPETFDPGDTASTDSTIARNAKAVVKHVKSWSITGEKLEMVLVGLADQGQYSLRIEGEDNIGNAFVATQHFTVGSLALGITDPYVYPNPFDPTKDRATIHFVLGGYRSSQVSVKIFDFAGDLVYTMPTATYQPGIVEIEWSGSTKGGTQVANGGYIARVTVDDGAGVKTENVKIAVRKD